MTILTILLQASELGLLDLVLQFGDAIMSMALLGYWVNTLQKQLEVKESNIKELNEYIRDNNVENLKTLSEFSKFLNNLITSVDSSKTDMLREVNTSADSIKTKIDSSIDHIKEKIDNLKTVIDYNGKTK